MAIYNRNKLAKELYVGSKPVRAVYAGSQKVWPSMPDDEIIFNGLRWKINNLTGLILGGGYEYNGNWYYNYLYANAAPNVVGGGWRLPTKAEFEALNNLQSFKGTENSRGFIFIPEDEGDALFFPFNGYMTTEATTPMEVSTVGYYWTSTPDTVYDNHNFAAIMGPLDSDYYTEAKSYDKQFPVRLVHDL